MVMRKMARAILLGGMAMAGVVLLSGPPRPAAMVGLGTGLKRFPAEVFIPLQRCAILERVQFLETLGHLQPLPAPAVLPLEQVGEHLLVRTRLSGVAEPIPLILDSGVRALILQRSRLPEVFLQDRVALNFQSSYGLIPQVTLGTAQFQQIGAYTVDFSVPGDPIWCLSEYGILGSNLTHHGVWQINYQTQTLTIADSLAQLNSAWAGQEQCYSSWNGQNADCNQSPVKIPLYEREGRPFIQLDLGDGNSLEAMVDTGWGGSIQLTEQHLPEALLTLPALVQAEGRVETLQGLATFRHRVVEIPSLSIGSLTLPDFSVQVASDPPGPGDALIGNDFLRHFIVTLDWSGQMLYLLPVDAVGAVYPRLEGYGFQTLVREQQLLITGLYRPSPAAAAGLQIDDQIVAINGDDYTAIPPELACDFIHHPVGERYDGPIAVTVRRGNRVSTHRFSPGVMLSPLGDRPIRQEERLMGEQLRNEDLIKPKFLVGANGRSPLRGLGDCKLICSRSLGARKFTTSQRHSHRGMTFPRSNSSSRVFACDAHSLKCIPSV
jgi:hypothetical protein